MAKRKSKNDAGHDQEKKTGADKAKKTAPKGLRAGLDFFSVLVGAVLIAVVIKTFVFDVYLIPSGSMETALHGRPDGGDRIFCSKLHYRFRDLKRWEIAVFEFPYDSAKANDPYMNNEGYRGQNFVKRVVGLPGERLAIARGDVWTKPLSGGEYRREVKPDRIQRDLWLNVYRQDFQDVDLNEFSSFWRLAEPDRMTLSRGTELAIRASPDDKEPAALHYRPRVPAGAHKDALPDLPGVPDRYALLQPIQIKCANVLPDGETCGHVFMQSTFVHNIEGRCPNCGSLQPETSVVFYHRRSGLPDVGPYAVEPIAALQGENVRPRDIDYHIVPDLRVVLDIAFADENGWCAVTLSEDKRNVQALFNASGVVELRINGAASRPEHRALAAMRPGNRHRIEFYVADGVARAFVDSTDEALLDQTVWDDKKPLPTNLPESSGVKLAFGGGDLTVSSLAIDRDIFYYSGWERKNRDPFYFMGPRGEALIANDAFFPMGDHCPSSYDARSWGPVPLSNLLGPALFIWWPPERIKRIQSP